MTGAYEIVERLMESMYEQGKERLSFAKGLDEGVVRALLNELYDYSFELAQEGDSYGLTCVATPKPGTRVSVEGGCVVVDRGDLLGFGKPAGERVGR